MDKEFDVVCVTMPIEEVLDKSYASLNEFNKRLAVMSSNGWSMVGTMQVTTLNRRLGVMFTQQFEREVQ